MLVDEDEGLPDEIPHSHITHEYYDYFAPDHRLNVRRCSCDGAADCRFMAFYALPCAAESFAKCFPARSTLKSEHCTHT